MCQLRRSWIICAGLDDLEQKINPSGDEDYFSVAVSQLLIVANDMLDMAEEPLFAAALRDLCNAAITPIIVQRLVVFCWTLFCV